MTETSTPLDVTGPSDTSHAQKLHKGRVRTKKLAQHNPDQLTIAGKNFKRDIISKMEEIWPQLRILNKDKSQ